MILGNDPKKTVISEKSFTLIELLIVIGILAILATAVLLVLNPTELLKQSRDSVRLSDLSSLNSAIGIYQAEGKTSLGTQNKVYVSIADSSATCANLGLPSLPSGWAYVCVPSSTLTKVDATGWVPVNFTSISAGSPLGTLPLDPINTTSTGDYYTYVTGGSWELEATLEAEKNNLGGNLSRVSTDGGTEPGLYEIGTNLALSPRDGIPVRSGLALHLNASTLGYAGLNNSDPVTTWTDISSQGNHATQSTTSKKPTFKPNMISGLPVVRFDGVDDDMAFGQSGLGTPITVFLVIRSADGSPVGILDSAPSTPNSFRNYVSGYWEFHDDNPRIYLGAVGTLPALLELVAYIPSNRQLDYYRNGVFRENRTGNNAVPISWSGPKIGTINGGSSGAYNGDIAEIIIYNSALSDSDRQKIESYLNLKYAIY